MSARARRTRLRARRRAALACLLGPGLLALLLDVARRHDRIFAFDAPHAAAYWLGSAMVVLLWAALLATAALPEGRARDVAAGFFAASYAFSTGVQAAFFARFDVLASFDTSFYSDSFPLTLVASFPLGVAGTLGAVAAAALLALLWLSLARCFVRPRGGARALAPIFAGLLVALAFATPVSYRSSIQSSPPDLVYFHSLSFHLGERHKAVSPAHQATLVRVQRRFPEAVPDLPPAAGTPRRNVLFLLQESLRADVTCTEHVERCDLATPATNELAPGRFPFLQMRAAASSTAVAVSNLWAGVDPLSSFERLHSTPLLWEYAKAAGYDTAYWTSQNLMFGNARLYVQDLPLSHFVSGSQLDPTSDPLTGASDEALSDHVIARWSELREPFFAVVHYSNIHKPRRVDPRRSPFQPSAEDRSRPREFTNHYLNAAYLSDLAVAKLVRHVRRSPSGARTVILYTADHGESLFENRNENDHSSTVYDEEIHVPAWIDAPEGTLTGAERASLAAKRDEYLVQYDIAPTVLDLFGVWETPAFAPFRERFLGRPLTRPDLGDRPVPLTNVSWVWEYWLPNWGMMMGSRKVLALADDERYRCHDVADDPDEAHDLGEAACADLVAAARTRFQILPRDMRDHIRRRPDVWGPWPPPPPP